MSALSSDTPQEIDFPIDLIQSCTNQSNIIYIQSLFLTIKVKTDRSLVSVQVLIVQAFSAFYVLIMSRVRHSSVHTEFVALHLVELVPGIGILTRSDHCGSNIQILVKVLPAYLTWTHTHTKMEKKAQNW